MEPCRDRWEGIERNLGNSKSAVCTFLLPILGVSFLSSAGNGKSVVYTFESHLNCIHIYEARKFSLSNL